MTLLFSPHTARLVQQRAAGDQATATALPELKEQLVNMSGRRNGVDLSENEVKVVVEHLKKFEGLGRKDPAKMDLSGTKWRVLFRHRRWASDSRCNGNCIDSTHFLYLNCQDGRHMECLPYFCFLPEFAHAIK